MQAPFELNADGRQQAHEKELSLNLMLKHKNRCTWLFHPQCNGFFIPVRDAI